ncbi:MAG: YceD family protein [Clostridia bacterium]
MSHQPVIDGFEFASAGATQQGVLPVSEFPRLRDLLASDAGEVAYEVTGLRDERGRPSLRLSVKGTVQVRCQRCLEAMPVEVDEEELLVLAATQAEIDADPTDAEAPDRVLGGKAMALRELVEDQLILALPYAPRHERCAGGAEKGREEAKEQDKVLPFAALKGMMRGRN